MRNVVALVGYSGAGKTRLITLLVRLLASKGYRVGVLKHTHARIKIDRCGTDTDRFRRAGATIAAIVDDSMMARFENGDQADTLIATLSQEVDILLIEGFKNLRLPKVVLTRNLRLSDRTGVVATYGERRTMATNSCRHFSPGQEDMMVRWLIECFIRSQAGPKVNLMVDGKCLIVKEYVAQTVAGVVAGLVGPLRGGHGRRVTISIDFGRKI